MNQHREKLTAADQVRYMRDERGIKFTIIKQFEAEELLSTRNYYFKIKAFEKNYNTYPSTPNTITAGTAGKYVDLEFAYLWELSALDRRLREEVLILSLSLEHYLRVRLINDITNNTEEDGYSIVDDFLYNYSNVRSSLTEKANGSYVQELLGKYSQYEDIPAWVLVEVLSFGDLINFSDLYYHKYPSKHVKTGNLRIVKFLRNAAAHNNCLIHNLTNNTDISFTQNRDANHFVSGIDGISNKAKNKKMSNRTIHDLVVLICTYLDIVTSNQTKIRQLQEFQKLLEGRFLEHKEYFDNNYMLQTNYQFVKKVVDKAIEQCV